MSTMDQAFARQLRRDLERLVDEYGFGSVLRMLRDIGQDLQNPKVAWALQFVDDALECLRRVVVPRG